MNDMKRILCLLSAAVIIYGCTSQLTPAIVDNPEPPRKEIKSSIPGTAYMFFSEETAALIENGDYSLTKSGMGIKSLERIIPDGSEFDARHHEAGLHRWYTVKYDKLITATKAAEGLSGMEGVMSVTFPREKKLCSTGYFNDKYFPLQWNLFNDGTLPSSRGKGMYLEGCDINVIPVWENYTTGSKNVIVAVMDGGADPDNKDLKDAVIPPGAHGSKTFVDGFVGNKLYPNDHGCNVSAIIGGVNNNSYGVAGVAGGNDGTGGVRILSCAIFMNDPDYPDDLLSTSDANLLQAYVYSADEGAIISNNSWGFVFDDEEDAAEYCALFESTDSPVRSGIDYFVKYAGRDKDGNQVGLMDGGLVVFAADNAGIQHACPAEYDKVFAVAAHGSSFNFATYSSYGDWVELVAPGGEDDPAESKEPYNMIIGPAPKGEFYYMAGTSQAAPHVSGTAALLVSYFGGPGLTNDKVWGYLIGGAKQDVLHGNMTGPMLDAAGSFAYASGSSDKISIVTSYTGDYSLKSHESLAVDFRILGNDARKLQVTLETACKAVSYRASASSLKMQIDALKDEPGTYPVCIYVGKGSKSEVTKKFDLTILPNHAPVVTKQIPDIWSNVGPNGSERDELDFIDLSGYFSDPDGETLKYEVTNEDESIVEVYSADFLVAYSPMDYGTSLITVKATDARGESVSQTFSYVGRDTSREFDIYPNPVHDILYVRAGSSRATKVELINAGGAVVISMDGPSSPSKPLKLDVSNLIPGSYIARISIAGNQMDDVIVEKI